MNWYIAHYIILKGVETITKMTQEEIDQMYLDLLKNEEEINAKGGFSIMTPQLQRDIVQGAFDTCNEDEHMECIAKMMAQSTYGEE